MSIADWIQITIAALTAGALVLAFFAIRRESGNAADARDYDRTARHVDGVMETARVLTNHLDLASAELMPFWKDPANKALYAQVPAEIAVHRHMEQARTSAQLLTATLAMMPQTAPEEAGRLKTAATLAQAALFTVYISLIDEKTDHTVKTLSRDFLSRGDDETAPAAREHLGRVTESAPANFADELLGDCRTDLIEKHLKNYVEAAYRDLPAARR